jgi:hypothetical protein
MVCYRDTFTFYFQETLVMRSFVEISYCPHTHSYVTTMMRDRGTPDSISTSLWTSNWFESCVSECTSLLIITLFLQSPQSLFNAFSGHKLFIYFRRDSAVRIATGYGLNDRGVGVRVPVGSRVVYSRRRPDRLWGPLSLLSNGYRV